jgi:hypothetical protein
MTPLAKTAKNLVMAVSLLLASAAATADDPPVSTQAVDLANKLNGANAPKAFGIAATPDSYAHQ